MVSAFKELVNWELRTIYEWWSYTVATSDQCPVS